ncbi:hypothetical protein TWF506_004713 [Arthrobotrys conoides]|uniref:Uncharacterized protein n=1 Tax=Arthrobotrys conoides TaxID=74498 RepID=A0AAN8RP24_9PEZI
MSQTITTTTTTNPQFPTFHPSKLSWADEVEEWEETHQEAKAAGGPATRNCGTNPQFPVVAAGKFSWAEEMEEEEEEATHSSGKVEAVPGPQCQYVPPPVLDGITTAHQREREERIVKVTSLYDWLFLTRPWVGNYPDDTPEEWRRRMKRHWDQMHHFSDPYDAGAPIKWPGRTIRWMGEAPEGGGVRSQWCFGGWNN